ncbi:MAG: nucleotidyltransferase family protein [Ghiorsea sp.]
MANSPKLRSQLSTALTHDINVWDFTNPHAELFANQQGIIEILWSIKNAAEPNVAMQEALQKKYAQHLQFRNAQRQALTALKQHQIPVVNMRGLALAECYGEQIIYRPQSDIDLLFHESNILMAKQALGSAGFQPSHAYPNIFVRGNIQLDTHVDPLGIERIKAWQHLTPLRAQGFFDESSNQDFFGEEAALVAPTLMLPYLCFHALKHSFERFVWLYDIALMSKQIEQLGLWDELLEHVQKYTLERPCFFALSYAKEHLGAPVPSDIIKAIKPSMGFIEKRLFRRHMKHQVIPFLAERLFSRMQPSFKHRLEFWRETIYPSYKVRKQMTSSGCVKCNFIRKRLKQLWGTVWTGIKEIFFTARA